MVAALGIPLALRKRQKESSQNVAQFLHHLQGIGVKVSLLEKGAEEEKIGVSRASVQRSEGVIKIEKRNINYINIISVSSQYGVNYFLDYLVTSPDWSGNKNKKKTKMVRKKSSGIWGRVVDIEWKGDNYLSRQLNLDYRLKDRLLQIVLEGLKDDIWIFPEQKYEYSRVRTSYLLPHYELFEAIDIVGGHIKWGW